MIAAMKLISLGFDVDAGKVIPPQQGVHPPRPPSTVETLAYLLCPSNCVLGPWVSFGEYTAAYQPSKLKWVTYLRAVWYCVQAFKH